MKKILGKIAILLLPLWLLASSVNVSVDKDEVTRGDSVTFTITAEGKNIDFPTINSIGGYDIIGTSQSSNISIINGNIKKSISKSYTFTPLKDVTIPSFEVKIDGKVYKTNPIKIRVVDTPTKSSSNSNVVFKIITDKKRAFVGEPIYLDVILKYKKHQNIVDSKIQTPNFPNFWVKKVGNTKVYQENDYIVKKERFIIFPQKAGSFEIGPLVGKLAKRVTINQPFINDPFFNDNFFKSMLTQIQTKQIISNSIKIDAKPLPNNLELYGKFTIKADVDKRVVEANKPVRVKIKIDGYGNIDDVKKFNLNIPNAVVYADEPKIKSFIKNSKYAGTFTQTITIVADSNFTIPPFVLKYVDSTTNKPVEIKTKPIKIEVKGGNTSYKKTEPKIAPQTKTTQKISQIEKKSKKPELSSWIIFFIGFIFGILTLLIISKFKEFKKEKKPHESNIAKAIKNAKSDKALLELLLPYIKKDPYIEEAIKKLEENIFQDASHKIDKKLLADIIEEIENKGE